jgi:hypothetical protein
MVLGLLLVLLSGAAVALLTAYNRSGGPDYSIEMFGEEIAVVNGMQIFYAGIALALVFCLGLWLMALSARRSRTMRAEIRAARHDAQAAAAERDRLASQVGSDSQTTVAGYPTTIEEPARRRFLRRRHEQPHDERTPSGTVTP